MATNYLGYTCKTCGARSRTQEANARIEDGKRYLHCGSGHAHFYDAKEVEILPFETDEETRSKMGLPSLKSSKRPRH